MFNFFRSTAPCRLYFLADKESFVRMRNLEDNNASRPRHFEAILVSTFLEHGKILDELNVEMKVYKRRKVEEILSNVLEVLIQQ